MVDVPEDTLRFDDGDSLFGLCGHCQIMVDNHDPNHRVSALLRGGRGVECVLRGDIHVSEAAPLGNEGPRTERGVRW